MLFTYEYICFLFFVPLPLILIRKAASGEPNSKPNIIFIIGDDMGWNDVGFHGSNEIPTPNMDALAYNGLILNKHYVLPTCTPSRSALFTGKYPIRTGMQGSPIEASVPIGLPLNETILPQYLKRLGYVTRLVGKWHLGFYQNEYVPINRGFDSHFGYYNGWITYNDSSHMTEDFLWGYDARNNFEHAADRFRNKYSTDVFTEEAVKIIKNHNTSKPLFLDVSHAAGHACLNNTLQVKDAVQNDKKFAHITDPNRRLYAGVMTAFDESVGKIVEALDERKMLQNSIILLMSDNGGSTGGDLYRNTGSNWPLRGWKSSLAEGGVRVFTSIWSPFTLKYQLCDQLIHISDWLPTLYAAAGGNAKDLGEIDGKNQWEFLTGIREKSARNEVLLNVNEETDDYAIIVDDWKYFKATDSPIAYTGANGREQRYTYNMEQVLSTSTHAILKRFYTADADDQASQSEQQLSLHDLFVQLRNDSTIDFKCVERINTAENGSYEPNLECFATGCLFNLKVDPCEFHDLSGSEVDRVKQLAAMIDVYRSELTPQQERQSDPRSDPIYWGYYWSPWIRNASQLAVFPYTSVTSSTASAITTYRDVIVFASVVAILFVVLLTFRYRYLFTSFVTRLEYTRTN